jgi:hypothetical protein
MCSSVTVRIFSIKRLVADDPLQLRLLLQRLQPHNVLGPHRLELASPTLVGLHRDLQMPADRVDVSAFSLQPIGLTELPHDLLRRVWLPLQLSHLLARSGDRDSHNGWTNFRGSGQLALSLMVTGSTRDSSIEGERGNT